VIPLAVAVVGSPIRRENEDGVCRKAEFLKLVHEHLDVVIDAFNGTEVIAPVSLVFQAHEFLDFEVFRVEWPVQQAGQNKCGKDRAEHKD